VRRRIALLAIALGVALGGCAQREPPTGPAALRVTRDFGREPLATGSVPWVEPGQSVLDLLQAETEVETTARGAEVRSIDGLPRSPGARWSYFVNGSAPRGSAARRPLAPGEVIQWDLSPRDVAPRVPAIVGAYPEPFRSGYGAKRVPVRVECDDDRSRACETVKERLTRAGAPASGARLNTEAGPGVLRVVVAPWRAARSVQAASAVGRGPAESGVFARFSEDARELFLLDASGRRGEPAAPGTGLLAATQATGQRPVWVVTGVDSTGVERAAAALDPRALRDAYAVAATPDGIVRLPLRDAG
jgi:hypothetical protein